MLEAFVVQALGDVELAQQVDGVLLEQPGPDPFLDVLTVSRLEHDAVGAVAVE